MQFNRHKANRGSRGRRNEILPGSDLPQVEADVFQTDLGWAAIVGSRGLLRRVLFGYSTNRAVWQALDREFLCPVHLHPWQPRLAEQMKAFAWGEVQTFDGFPLDFSFCSEFARHVLSACRQIRWGQTKTYGQLAAECGSPRAARAVGNVMATNRFPLIVPCHRVVAAGGRLGGFSAPQGSTLKKRLLRLEQRSLPLPEWAHSSP